MWRRFLSVLLALSLGACLVMPALAVEVEDSVDSFDLTDFYESLGFDDPDQFDDFIFYLMGFEGVFQTDLPVYLIDGGYDFVPYDAAYDLFFYLSQVSTLDIYGSWTAQGSTYYTTTTVNQNGSLRMTSPLATYTYSTGSVNTFGLACQISSLTSTVAEIAAASGGCVWTAADISSLMSGITQIHNDLKGSASTSIYDQLFVNQTPTSAGVLGGMLTALSQVRNQFLPGGVMIGPTGQVLYDWKNNKLTTSTNNNVSIPNLLGYVYNQIGRSGESTYNALWNTHNAMTDTLNSDFDTFNANQDTRATFLNNHLTSEFSTTNTNLVGSDRSTTFSSFLFDSALNRTTSTTSVNNLLDAIGWLGSAVQRPLSQLQAVLANDDDLRLRQETQEEVDAITDSFTGDGGAAPTTDNIGDMAGISADFSGMFDSGVGAGDLMGVINGGDTYSFFSQETADSLDTAGNAGIATASDMLDDLLDLSGYVETEDGILVPVNDFLRREG